MKEKHLLIVALILFCLVVYYNLFEYGYGRNEAAEQQWSPIIFLQYGDVKKVSATTSDGKESVFERTGNRWRIIKGTQVERWQEKVQDFVMNLLMTVEIDKIPADEVELSAFGLDNPRYRITITDVTDKSYQLLVGKQSPTRTSVYAKFADSPSVLVVGALLNWEISKIDPLLTAP
ncbi:MAG: DUF4340 domain-containing protein [Deltaproteobacteria bacterium]|nr:DUF4340 domain-containing protein [Deltaproteobacteria bacterium]